MREPLPSGCSLDSGRATPLFRRRGEIRRHSGSQRRNRDRVPPKYGREARCRCSLCAEFCKHWCDRSRFPVPAMPQDGADGAVHCWWVNRCEVSRHILRFVSKQAFRPWPTRGDEVVMIMFGQYPGRSIVPNIRMHAHCGLGCNNAKLKFSPEIYKRHSTLYFI